jgi:Kef-type K+ transport system membrane component KefB
VVTILFGFAAGLFFQLPWLAALFLGIALSATSVGISAQTLMELGVMRRRESLTLLGAAVIDDLVVLLVLSIFLALSRGAGGGLASVLVVLARVVVFFLLAVMAGFLVIPRATAWAERLPIRRGLVSFVIVAVLLYAWAAEVIGGIAAITGAFLVGLAFARTSLQREIENSFSPFTYGFFVPLFFVSIGIQADIRGVSLNSLLFATVLVVVVFVSKTLGAGLGAWWGGLTRSESVRLGLGMISLGEVVLIVSSVGLNQNLIDEALFAEIVLVVLATTLLTPLLLRWAYARADSEEKGKETLPAIKRMGE